MTGTRSGTGSVERGSFNGSEETARPFDRDGEPDVVRLCLDAGESVAPHSHPERRVVFFVVEGRFEVRLDDDSYPVGAGDCLRFDGDREISPRATESEPATALVVLARTRT
jgi:mannose-6-phosphate isomerase-like protein (cupin superfamily)